MMCLTPGLQNTLRKLREHDIPPNAINHITRAALLRKGFAIVKDGAVVITDLGIEAMEKHNAPEQPAKDTGQLMKVRDMFTQEDEELIEWWKGNKGAVA